MADVVPELLRTAYEGHVALVQHYSGLVFRGRLSIVTLTVVAVSVALGLVPGVSVVPSPVASGLLAYASACLVALLHAVEVSYVKRFFQVVASGIDLEHNMGIRSYFTRYDKPEGWPLRIIYFFAVALLLAVALVRLWKPSEELPLRPLIIVAGCIAPFLPLTMSVRRAQEAYRTYFPKV